MKYNQEEKLLVLCCFLRPTQRRGKGISTARSLHVSMKVKPFCLFFNKMTLIRNVSRSEAAVLSSPIFSKHACCANQHVLYPWGQCSLKKRWKWSKSSSVTCLMVQAQALKKYSHYICCFALCTLACTGLTSWFSEKYFHAQRFCPFSNIPPAWCVMPHLLRQVWLGNTSQRYWMWVWFLCGRQGAMKPHVWWHFLILL